MDDRIPHRNNHAGNIKPLLALAATLFALASCGHHPPKENTVGEQFLGKRTVKAVYQDDHGSNRHRQNIPINRGDEFEIVRSSKNANAFEFVPGDNFRGDPGWKGLRLNYNPGVTTNEPVPLIAEVCTKEQSSEHNNDSTQQGEMQYDYISANVQNDFLNLSGRGLEFLESEPIQFGGKPHIIHIFHIMKIGAKEVSLVIFYCDENACNHRGMIDA